MPPWCGADHAAARGGGLERGVGERVGLLRGNGDDVGGAEDQLGRPCDAGEVHAVGHAEGGGRARSSSRRWRSSPRHGAPAISATASLGQRGPSARTRTSWPFQPEMRPEDRDDERVVGRPSAARASARGARAGG